MVNDPISDMLTRIRNAQKAEHKTVIIPLSDLKFEIAKILKKENYISDFSTPKGRDIASGGKKLSKGGKKVLEINLKYPAAINEIKRISKPGLRVYVGARKVKNVKSGYGISIISTSKGLMTNKEARNSRLGGEVLLEVS